MLPVSFPFSSGIHDIDSMCIDDFIGTFLCMFSSRWAVSFGLLSCKFFFCFLMDYYEQLIKSREWVINVMFFDRHWSGLMEYRNGNRFAEKYVELLLLTIEKYYNKFSSVRLLTFVTLQLNYWLEFSEILFTWNQNLVSTSLWFNSYKLFFFHFHYKIFTFFFSPLCTFQTKTNSTSKSQEEICW